MIFQFVRLSRNQKRRKLFHITEQNVTHNLRKNHGLIYRHRKPPRSETLRT